MAYIDSELMSSDITFQGSDPDSNERIMLLRETVSSLMNASGGVSRQRQQRAIEPGFNTKLWKEMADLGWLGIPVPEELGGLGLGIRDLCVVAHEMGKWLAPEPFVASVALGAGVLWRGENRELKEQLLPKMIVGELCPALAWQESVGTIDVTATKVTTVKRQDGKYLINGNKKFVHGPMNGFIVSAVSSDGLGAYWVPSDSSGLVVNRSLLADGTFISELTLTDVCVSNGSIISNGHTTSGLIRESINDALVAASAELLGIMDVVLQKTTEYLSTRVQFGRRIGEFQALQHRMVDLLLMKEQACCAIRNAIEVFENTNNIERCTEAAARAKFRASRSATAITRGAVHLHGAMGFTDECDIGMYLKRAIVLSAWLGNGDVHMKNLSNTAGWIESAWD